jgi:hypothetical protein
MLRLVTVSPDDAPDPRAGSVIQGRYKLLAPIASGGMGVVYRGERLQLGRSVAIKFLHPWAAHPRAAAGRRNMSVKTAWIGIVASLAGCSGSTAMPVGRKDAGSIVVIADGPAPHDAAPDPYDALPNGGCEYAGLTLLPEQWFADPSTPCQLCRCGSDGTVTCNPSYYACCPLSSTDFLAVDEIRYENGCSAMTCRFDQEDWAELYSKPGCYLGCFYANQWHYSGTHFPADSGCGGCRCDSGVVTCSEVTCSRCVYYGYSYPDGTDFVAANGLDTCRCTNGQVACTAQGHPDGTCTYFGTAYAAGAEFLGKDGCSRCRCFDGRVHCNGRECLRISGHREREDRTIVNGRIGHREREDRTIVNGQIGHREREDRTIVNG